MERTMKYNTKTESAVKNALLGLLAKKPLSDVTVSELARAAGVSRSTFYEHFGNPGDVFEALVDEIADEMSPLMSQVACSDGFRPQGRPFCSLVRDAGERAPVVCEQRFMDAFLTRHDAPEGHDLYELLVGVGYTEVQAKALCSFQMSGCFAAARTTKVSEEEWVEVRAAIDRFILGGIAACLAAKHR